MKLLDKNRSIGVGKPLQPKANGRSSVPEYLFSGRRRVFIVSFAFLFIVLMGGLALALWFWLGSLEESVPGVGQIIPQGKLRRVMAPVNGLVSTVYVQENSRVKAGQVMVELNPEVASIEKEGLQEQLHLLRQEADALRAAVNGQQAVLPATDYGMIQSEWIFAAKQAYGAQMEAARMDIEERQHRYQEAIQRLKQAQDVLMTSENLLANYQALYQEGGISAKEVQEYQQRVDNQRGEVASLQETVKAERGALGRARRRPLEIQGNYRRDILARLAEHQQRIVQVEKELEKGKFNLAHQRVLAPIDGIVNEQIIRGPGDVVAAGQTLFSVVPADSQLMAEVRVSNRDLSFIHLNQRAALRLDAFPYQHFGRLFGRVVAISPSTQQASRDPAQEATAKPPANTEQPFYIIMIKPDRLVMTGIDGSKKRIRPGMTLSADIITREKNILSFFTEPIHLHFYKAFRDPSNR